VGKAPCLMTETNTPKSAKKLRWTSLEIGLITIVSLLFIVIIALIILFATQKTDMCMMLFQIMRNYNKRTLRK
uniref:Uncharacterized protein n=1 Tax=Amphilophus citrinellus TaxID=61819 RepID=A0A3Q0SHD5_AMPCI